MSLDIAEAKRLLPLPDLLASLGLSAHAQKSARCPFHDDSHKSFSVFESDGSHFWKCFAGCGSGDEITLLEKLKGLTKAEAIRYYCELARVNGSVANKPAVAPTSPRSEADLCEQWRACVAAFDKKHLTGLTKWRGYSVDFCQWLKQCELVGIHRGLVAFPVHGDGGAVVAFHVRTQDGKWFYEPRGAAVRPLVIGDCKTADAVFVFESQWDAFAVLDKLAWHKSNALPDCAVIVTRGAANGGKLGGLAKRGATVYAFRQNDEAAEKWLTDATAAATAGGATVKLVATPAPHKDCNEWTKAGATAKELNAAITAALDATPAPPAVSVLEFLRPSELRDYRPPKGVVLMGDCHVVRGNIFVIGGAPGVGKSRAAVAMAVAGATGADWFGLKVHARFRTMIVQNENGRFRLSREFADLDCPALEDFVRVCPPPPLGLAFDRPEFQAQFTAAIAVFNPDVIVIDPWNAVARDEKARDYLDTFNALRAVIPPGDTAPALGIVAHTRKPKGDERATGRGLLNLLAGSYVLGSFPRTVFVMQAGTDDPSDDRIVWTCCKNNDGELGQRTAWRRRNGLFTPAEDFDWTDFDHPPTGRPAAKITPEDVAATIGVEREIAYTRLVEQLAERFKVTLRTGKTAIARASEVRTIRKNENGLYEAVYAGSEG